MSRNATAGVHLIGSRAWFLGENKWGQRGTVDAILCLLMAQKISHAKARELLRYAVEDCYDPGRRLPMAPWADLVWNP